MSNPAINSIVPIEPVQAAGGRRKMNLSLRKFDMSQIKDDKVVVFIGKRDTGKSFLIRDLLYYHQNIPIGTVISGTESANSFYGSIVPPLFIHEEFNPLIIQNLLKRQKTLALKIQKDFQTRGTTSVDPRTFMIMDDCLYDNTWARDKYIRSLFMNGRHWKILYIVAMQYCMGIPPNLRTNIDYVFILRENNVANRKRLYEQYAGMFPDFDSFCQIMDQCTENYECLVINNNAKSNKIEDQVFWYKAQPHPNFRIGLSEFWNQKPPEPGDDVDDFDPSATGRKSRGPIIQVKKY
jgi:hypothetical protein